MARISQHRAGYKNQINEANRTIVMYMCWLGDHLLQSKRMG